MALLVLFSLTLCINQTKAQQFDPTWYDASQPYVKIGVVEDGVYGLSGADLTEAGVVTSSIVPRTLKLYENGREIPIQYLGSSASFLEDSELLFIGKRNRGTEEDWAYNNKSELRSSTHFSLFTDTTYYWLTWGGPTSGLRYDEQEGIAPAEEVTVFRDTLHFEPEDVYYFGDNVVDVRSPFLTRGEGYYWRSLSHNNTSPRSQTYTGTLTGLTPSVQVEDSLYIQVQLNSTTPTRHRMALEIETEVEGTKAFQTFDELEWDGRALLQLRAAVSAEDAALDNNNRLRVRLTSFNEFNAVPNTVFIDWIDISYVRTLDAQEGALRFSPPRSAAQAFTIEGFGGSEVFIFNPHGRRLFRRQPTEGTVTFSDTPSEQAEYWATAREALKTPATLSPDAVSDWAATDNAADYLILTTPALATSAEAMADYHRAQNGFEVALVYVQDVFDQFEYGRITPLAIQRFVHQTQRWRVKPRFLLIWGDVLYPDRDRPRLDWEIPTLGRVAPSDAWFAMQTKGPQDWTETLAIGRVPVRDNDQGALFLEKLSAYEATPLAPWKKRMLAMAGGFTPQEQSILGNHMNRWATQAADPPVGMDTLRFFKTSSDALDQSFRDSLRVALREGAAWLSYFGHAAAQTWDIVTDPPEDFDNAERLPIAVSLGCLVGAFSGPDPGSFPSLAEQLVLGSLNGAIAHWGTTGLSTIGGAARVGNPIHELVFADSLIFEDSLRTIGTLFQEAKRRYTTQFPSLFTELLQHNLIGDPATQLNIPRQPDFQISQEQIRITPVTAVPADSQLTVTVRLRNQGLFPSDSLTFQLIHTLPSGTETEHVIKVEPFALEKQIDITIPIREDMIGENVFRVTIDPENIYQEVLETNNVAEQTHLVFSQTLSLISPFNLSTVPAAPVLFRAALSTLTQQESRIIFELDESPTFDSPALKTFDTVTPNTYALWEFTEPLQHGKKYFWRARLDIPNEPFRWQEASFSVQDDPSILPFWRQDGASFELSKNDDRVSWQGDQWVFNTFDIEVEPIAQSPQTPTPGGVLVNGERLEQRLDFSLGFAIVILDGQRGTIRAHGSGATYENTFEDPVAAKARLDSLANLAREGDYLFVKTWHIGNRGTPEIAEDVKTLFRSLGSTAIDTLTYDHLWILSTRIGSPEETREWVAPNEVIDLRQKIFIPFPYPEGTTGSPLIGPAQAWASLRWEAELPNETSQVQVDVLDAATGETLLGGFVDPAQPVDLSSLDARRHPFVQLRATLSDTVQRATPQLKGWAVDYTPTAEILIDTPSFTLTADTLQEGKPLTVSTSLLNFSDYAADSVAVRLQLTDASNSTRLVAADTLLHLAPETTEEVSFVLDTDGLVGRNLLTFRVEQPGLVEALLLNNTFITGFTVQSDRDPPMLRVTIDGVELPPDPNPIRDLQDPNIPLLSTRPTIEIVFSDDNVYKPLTDTTLVVLTLDDEPLSFSDPDIVFEPATETQNRARILYTPDFTGQDAVHTLRVRVFDASGNEAEESPYQVHFRISSTFKVESLYPYPNPMSSFTQFAFLLQGADPSVVEDFRIRVYTLTGRVVREFDLIEDPSALDGGLLRIGWNKLPWDGRDEDGDLLATGVYLYKVFLQAEGQTVYINNDSSIEKLVIIR